MQEEMSMTSSDSMSGVEAAPDVMAGLGIGMMIFWVGLILLLIAASWRLFTKAGKPGWASLVPIYNIVVMLEITGKPMWWLILMFVPFVNFAVAIMLTFSLAKVFGKSTLFGLGLFLLGILFYPILAFGDARYQGPAPASA